jgi:hypothetical protein
MNEGGACASLTYIASEKVRLRVMPSFIRTDTRFICLKSSRLQSGLSLFFFKCIPRRFV